MTLTTLTPNIKFYHIRSRNIQQFSLVWNEEPFWDWNVKIRDDDGTLVHQVNEVGYVVVILYTIVLEIIMHFAAKTVDLLM